MVHFVGAGPGAPDLITVRGAALLGRADVVIYAGSLVNPELLALCREGCRVLDSSKMTLEGVLGAVAEAEARGEETVRLHTGDPSLYGAVREQMEALDRMGVPYDVVPGVSSLFGAAASLKCEYTVPGVSQALVVCRLPGRTPVPAGQGVADLAASGASMAVFLSAGMPEELQAELLKGAFTEDTPAAVVYKATWPEERVARCRLGELAVTVRALDASRTALVLVGGFLGEGGERSRLYDPGFSTGYRKAER